MKKLVKYILPVIFLSSCQKYVDIKKSGLQSFIETTNDVQLVLDNYDLFNVNYPIDGEISADDYYLDDNRYNSDLITLEDKAIYTWNPQAIRLSATQWTRSYNKIYHCNLALEALDVIKPEAGQDDVVNNLRGTALFLRAYSLWPLSQMYMKPYSEANLQEPGLPLHTKSDINDTPGKATVKETYDAIIKDLTEAVSLLNRTSTIASRPNKSAANAMLARVYLSIGNYADALASAKAALLIKNDQTNLINFNTLNQASFNPFTRFNKEVIFHSVIDRQNSVLEVGFGTENAALIAPEIIDAYQPNDLRKNVYVKENIDIPNPTGTFRFVGNYEGAAGSAALFNGLALDELHLIAAECYARTNQLPNAISEMNTLLVTRWKTGTYQGFAASNPTDAITKILLERRKELLMRGVRWTDLRRLNMDKQYAKTLSRVVGGVVNTLPPNDSRYTLLIPQEVITYSKLDQNKR